jgi:Formiminotransferase domain, N-terminal subdomain
VNICHSCWFCIHPQLGVVDHISCSPLMSTTSLDEAAAVARLVGARLPTCREHRLVQLPSFCRSASNNLIRRPAECCFTGAVCFALSICLARRGPCSLTDGATGRLSVCAAPSVCPSVRSTGEDVDSDGDGPNLRRSSESVCLFAGEALGSGPTAMPVLLYGAAHPFRRPLSEVRRVAGYFAGAGEGQWRGGLPLDAAALAPDFGPQEV